jgi:hypothetical protein
MLDSPATPMESLMGITSSAWLPVPFVICSIIQPAAAKDRLCDAQSQKGETCLCKIAALHPTQSSVGMAEVAIKAEKLKAKIEKRSESDFLGYLKKHEKEEPVTIGPGGVFYITDHHHLARALSDIGVEETYCTIVDNLSGETPDAFWKQLEANNEVYLKDQNGESITPQELPASVKDLTDNPFRSLAGAVRESCGFQKGDPNSSGEDYIEFRWADYLRAHWAGTGIAIGDIDAKFANAASAALQLAAQKDAEHLPGFTGKTSCD